jgi:thiol-disulfide isomerase/thioredoxin
LSSFRLQTEPYSTSDKDEEALRPKEAMAEFKEVEGYDSLKKELEALNTSEKPVYVLFTGSKDSSGKSWCPDCVTGMRVVRSSVFFVERMFSFSADPIVHDSVKKNLTNGVFITCQVGQRDL